ncbi:MAG TPA: hypothetical protein PKN21_08770, partial [Bacteroidales bacterium]|nr:hypothetical protein [Bacteroidales bacterium]
HPSWTISVNRFTGFLGANYGLGASKPTDTPKPGFDFEKWKGVNDKLSTCFYLVGQKEELGKGIDRYISEIIVM